MPKKSDRAEIKQVVTSALDRQPYVPSDTQLHRISGLFIAAHERGWTYNTYLNNKYKLRNIYEVLGPVEVADIDRSHVEQLVAARRRAGMCGLSIVSEYRVLAALLAWCFKQGIIPHVVTRMMRLRDFDLPVQRYDRGTPLLTLMRRHQENLK